MNFGALLLCIFGALSSVSAGHWSNPGPGQGPNKPGREQHCCTASSTIPRLSRQPCRSTDAANLPADRQIRHWTCEHSPQSGSPPPTATYNAGTSEFVFTLNQGNPITLPTTNAMILCQDEQGKPLRSEILHCHLKRDYSFARHTVSNLAVYTMGPTPVKSKCSVKYPIGLDLVQLGAAANCW